MAEPYVDPYLVLGLDHTATLEEIKRAYFALVRAHPPERDPEAFKRIRAAYERLRTPEQRLEADMLLLQTWPVPTRFPQAADLDLRVHREDVLAAARALSDLERTDFHGDFRKVKL